MPGRLGVPWSALLLLELLVVRAIVEGRRGLEREERKRKREGEKGSFRPAQQQNDSSARFGH